MTASASYRAAAYLSLCHRKRKYENTEEDDMRKYVYMKMKAHNAIKWECIWRRRINNENDVA